MWLDNDSDSQDVTVTPPDCRKGRLSWLLKYVVVTAAHNEARYIEDTIRSMLLQTILPQRWVIVDNGSTDNTSHILLEHCRTVHWIRYLSMPQHGSRSFAAKTRCIEAAYRTLDDVDFDLLACVDADVTFPQGYLEFLISKFVECPDLGVAGTTFREGGRHSHSHLRINFEDPPGPCQVFRRECFDEVGGYRPMEQGGEDTIAATMARMRGWQTCTFSDVCFQHNRTSNTAGRNILSAFFHLGHRDATFHNHLLWEVLRVGRHMTFPPYFIRGMAFMVGYLWGTLRMGTRHVPTEVIEFRRQEQRRRMKALLGRGLHRIGVSPMNGRR